MPGEEVWLVGERCVSGEQKYYLANLAPEASLKTPDATIKARWICQQAHQQLTELPPLSPPPAANYRMNLPK
jgi:hypothetical protein